MIRWEYLIYWGEMLLKDKNIIMLSYYKELMNI